jgi:hypothetical protein
MKLANYDDRATLVFASGGVDVRSAFDGRFGSSTQVLYDRWQEFSDFSANVFD